MLSILNLSEVVEATEDSKKLIDFVIDVASAAANLTSVLELVMVIAYVLPEAVPVIRTVPSTSSSLSGVLVPMPSSFEELSQNNSASPAKLPELLNCTWPVDPPGLPPAAMVVQSRLPLPSVFRTWSAVPSAAGNSYIADPEPMRIVEPVESINSFPRSNKKRVSCTSKSPWDISTAVELAVVEAVIVAREIPLVHSAEDPPLFICNNCLAVPVARDERGISLPEVSKRPSTFAGILTVLF